MNSFSSRVLYQHKNYPARVMEFTTWHGKVVTPAFMPVGTRAAVNNISSQMLEQTQSQIILGGNTYHMLVAPGMDVIQQAGGMHNFMQWHGPMLTDSGGFQVFSLAKNNAEFCKITADGVSFYVHALGQWLHLNAEKSLATQKIIGADIIMAFDECTPLHADTAAMQRALTNTHAWLLRALDYQAEHPNSVYGYPQALFGIIQGGNDYQLRIQSAEFVAAQPVAGIAIGGAQIGFNMPETLQILDWLQPILPAAKIRYTMGVGLEPQNLIDVVRAGVDIFDCVAPTRNARHGALYCGEILPDADWIKFVPTEPGGRILIKKQIYRTDERPIAASCNCYTCQHYSRAQLHVFFKTVPLVYSALATLHNIAVMQQVCLALRACIEQHSVAII